MLQKKICILGASGVGKTSLVKQYVEGIFSEKYHTSIGVKIDKKIVELSSNILSKNVQLIIWDLEGIDKYCGFNPRYLRGASGIILVADQTRISSLADAKEINSMAMVEANIPTVLAVNKTDMPLSENWHETLSSLPKNDFADIVYTSAKTGDSVDTMFQTIASHVVN